MKRFVVAGFFFTLGLLVLGVVTSYLISPDRPQPQRPAAANETPRAHSPRLQQQPQQEAPYMTSAKPVQPAAAPLPGMPVPLSTTVPPAMKPAPVDNTPHVPAISSTDESASRGK